MLALGSGTESDPFLTIGFRRLRLAEPLVLPRNPEREDPPTVSRHPTHPELTRPAVPLPPPDNPRSSGLRCDSREDADRWKACEREFSTRLPCSGFLRKIPRVCSHSSWAMSLILPLVATVQPCNGVPLSVFSLLLGHLSCVNDDLKHLIKQSWIIKNELNGIG